VYISPKESLWGSLEGPKGYLMTLQEKFLKKIIEIDEKRL
jgi:hypothetical protein